MRFLIINHIQNARESIRSSKVRSALTMLGVAVGVASVTSILSLSDGATTVISSQIDSMDGNIAIIRPGSSNNPLDNIVKGQLQYEYATSTLTENDVDSILQIPHVKSVAPIMVIPGKITADSTAPSESSIIATSPSFAEISNLQLHEGAFLDDTTDRNIAVVGAQLSVNVFGSDSSVGRTLKIKGQDFIVTGVLERTNNPINYNQVDLDNTVIINLAIGKNLNDTTQIQQINVQADSVNNLDKVVDQINKTVTNNHYGVKDFSTLTGNKISQPTNQLFYTITGFMTAIAAISLIVGGIGIMNIMLVAVAERTREIGIRKAVGASNSDILWQLLIESLSISAMGGIGGYILGNICALVISNFLVFKPAINWQIALIALTISVVMGTLFGLYPAIRAARKDPIESLHQYE